MKADHPSEWSALMNRDPIIENLGEWTRWPLGSTDLAASLFKPEDYGDPEFGAFKREAGTRIKWLLSSSLFLFVVLLLLLSVGLSH
jgi:hypothetical protein